VWWEKRGEERNEPALVGGEAGCFSREEKKTTTLHGSVWQERGGLLTRCPEPKEGEKEGKAQIAMSEEKQQQLSYEEKREGEGRRTLYFVVGGSESE